MKNKEINFYKNLGDKKLNFILDKTNYFEKF